MQRSPKRRHATGFSVLFLVEEPPKKGPKGHRIGLKPLESDEARSLAMPFKDEKDMLHMYHS